MKIFGSHFLVLAVALALGYFVGTKYPNLVSRAAASVGA